MNVRKLKIGFTDCVNPARNVKKIRTFKTLKWLYLLPKFNSGMRYLYAFILFSLVGCMDSSDSVVSGGEFSVHFDNTEDYDLAKDIVAFYKKDSLLTGNPQDVRLQRTKEGYDLMLVALERKSMSELSFEEIRSLTELQKRLQEEVFKDKSVSLVISDENFKPLFRPAL